MPKSSPTWRILFIEMKRTQMTGRFPRQLGNNFRRVLTLVALVAAFGSQLARAGSGFAWEQQADSLALRQNGQDVWRFNFGANEGKPNFHPLALPAGPVVSCYRPKDHPWHRGLWFSWKYVNKVNYWEENRKTGLGEGKTEWRAPLVETHSDFSARLVLDLNYHPTNGPVVLTEHRVITVSAPDNSGAYYLDWDMTFHAMAEEVVLDRAPPVDEKGNNVSGGYAGLGIRAAEDFQQTEVITGNGAVKYENNRFRGQALALDFSGIIDGQMAGIAFLDNPANLNSPTPWYVINKAPMYYISPAVLTYHPKSLKAGESMVLRYRVVVHPGRWTEEQLQAASKHYAAGE
jgi:hypothetical protein